MRRITALALFVLGYMTMASLDTEVALAPCLVTFAAGAYALVRPELEPQTEAA